MVRLGFSLIAGLWLAGCSTFQRQTRADFAPFAEYTVSVASELQYGWDDTGEILYLTRYRDEPSVLAYGEEWEKMRRLIRAVVAYSLEVSTLGSSQLSGRDRTKALARFVDDLVRPVLGESGNELRITEAELDRIVADITSRKKLVDALEAAQPIIDEITHAADAVFRSVKQAQDTAQADIARRIEERYAEELLAYEYLQDTQSRLFRSVALLAEYRSGDESALPALRALNPDLERGEVGSLDSRRLLAIEERLWSRIERVREFERQLQPSLDAHQEERRELGRLVAQDNGFLRQAHTTVLAWSRVHLDLARGVTHPAQVDLLKISKEAVKVTPFY